LACHAGRYEGIGKILNRGSGRVVSSGERNLPLPFTAARFTDSGDQAGAFLLALEGRFVLFKNPQPGPFSAASGSLFASKSRGQP